MLERERTHYRNLTRHAQRVQLELPYAAHSSRVRLIDAILFAEEEVSGSIKCFARTDAESWTGTGHLFTGIFRPGAPRGNEFTFSVAPESGLSLLPLWLALEQAEEARWSGDRPRDAVRSGLPGYSKAAGGVTPSNDPWWDGGDDHTLVAAPGKFGVATRLDWSAVQEIIWQCFAPSCHLAVRHRIPRSALGSETPRRIVVDPEAMNALREDLCPGSGLHILDLERPAGHGEAPLLWNPTLERALGSLADGRSASLETLADASAFDLLRVGPSALVIAQAGVLMLTSPSDTGFPGDALRAEARDVAATLAVVRRLEAQLAEARCAVRKAIPSGLERDRRSALIQIYAIQLEARRSWPKSAEGGGGPLGTLRDLCEHRWQASRRFRDILEETRELESMITSSTENRTGSLVSALAIYGLPAALFGNVLGAAFGPMTAPGESPWNVALNAVYWFLALTALSSLTLFLVSWRNRRDWRKAMETRSG
jgi:hypothetical protein